MTLGYYVILAPGNLYKAIVSEDWASFRRDLINFTLIATATLVVKVLRGLLRESAANHIRNKLSIALHNFYLGSFNYESGHGASPYYRVAIEDKVDNPDQRIVTDARQFSIALLDILAGGQTQGADSGGLLEAFASLILYSLKTLERTGFYGVSVAYLWSLLVGAVTVFVINRTSPSVFRQEKLEADYRFAHAQLRTQVEEVSLLRGAPFEHAKLDSHLERAVSNQWAVILRHMFLNFVQYGFGYYVSIVMYLALALAVQQNIFTGSSTSFSSSMTAGEKAQWIAQTGGVFIQLLFSFTMVIQAGTTLSNFVSNANRLSSLIESLHEKSIDTPLRTTDPDAEPLIANEDGLTPHKLYGDVAEGFQVQNLVIQPGQTGLTIGPLSLSVKKGEWLLLEGPSGCGKSSVVRVLRGLWQPRDGILRIPADENATMFVPQAPYTPAGIYTLRQLVVYPKRCTGSKEEHDRVMSALEAVGWRQGHVRQDCDRAQDWATRLSRGEAQLIAIARLLAANPMYAVLDEPTASLDAQSEANVVRALHDSGISGMIIGHSTRLRALYSNVITMSRP